jgi:L-aspartate oxidase
MEHISDVLVIGSGLAGLGYALKVADVARVNLVTKRGLTETSTKMAQGGIAAVLGPDDRFEYHIQDTLTVGEGLSHPDIVELVVRQGPERIRDWCPGPISTSAKTTATIWAGKAAIPTGG